MKVLTFTQVQQILYDEVQSSLIIHTSCTPEVELKEPASITIPITLEKEQKKIPPDLLSSHVRIYSSDSSSEQWDEITSQLKTPAKLADGVVTFEVNHLKKHR